MDVIWITSTMMINKFMPFPDLCIIGWKVLTLLFWHQPKKFIKVPKNIWDKGIIKLWVPVKFTVPSFPDVKPTHIPTYSRVASLQKVNTLGQVCGANLFRIWIKRTVRGEFFFRVKGRKTVRCKNYGVVVQGCLRCYIVFSWIY